MRFRWSAGRRRARERREEWKRRAEGRSETVNGEAVVPETRVRGRSVGKVTERGQIRLRIGDDFDVDGDQSGLPWYLSVCQ